MQRKIKTTTLKVGRVETVDNEPKIKEVTSLKFTGSVKLEKELGSVKKVHGNDVFFYDVVEAENAYTITDEQIVRYGVKVLPQTTTTTPALGDSDKVLPIATQEG